MLAAPSRSNTLLEHIAAYKKRFFQNQLLKGSLLFVALITSIYLLINTAEFIGRFGPTVRTILFFSFWLISLYCLYRWIISPILNLAGLRKPLSDTDAAIQIGRFFPEIGDRLLNTIQLQQLSSKDNELLEASLRQRSQQLLVVRFANAININENRRFVPYVLIPLFIIGFFLLFKPGFLTNPSTRLVHFNQEFVEEAPFTFVIDNPALTAFRNENFTLSVHLTGQALPASVFLVSGNSRLKLESVSTTHFRYTFDNLQRNLPFYLEASGFRSPTYNLTILDKPAILTFKATLHYPAYLHKQAETLTNVGNLLVPQGTTVRWVFKADHTDSLAIRFQPKNFSEVQKTSDNEFSTAYRFLKTTPFDISLRNKHTPKPTQIQYTAQVILDNFPHIEAQQVSDTVTYNALGLSGSIGDDYGLTRLNLQYRLIRKGTPQAWNTISIPIHSQATSQNFSYAWSLIPLKLLPTDKLEYYLQVWDNDGVNGSKSARTPQATFSIPSFTSIQEQIEQSATQTSTDLNQALLQAQKIKSELSALENRLRTKRSSDFQDTKQLEALLRKRDELMQQLQKLQNQFERTSDTQQRFQNEQQQSEKFDQLQNIFKDLQDPESKQLYEALQKLLETKQFDKAENLFNRLNNKEKNMQRELARSLQLFKQMQYEQKLRDASNELKKQAENLEKESKENQQIKDPSEKDSKSRLDAQEKANKDFSDLQKQLEKLQNEAKQQNYTQPKVSETDKSEVKQQLDSATESLQDSQQQQESQNQTEAGEQQESQTSQQKGNQTQKKSQQQKAGKQQRKPQHQNAAQQQKNAASKMREMADQMEDSMESSQMSQMMENLDDLRKILENLISLSFSQERLMKEFKAISVQDPRIIKLSQEQIKLQQDAAIIDDSLTALASRVVQIQPFITRELSNMKYYMDESVQNLRSRRFGMASSRQQFAMTSMNNLALMLSNVQKSMMQQMQQMQVPGQGSQSQQANDPKDGKGNQQLSERQKQLNERMGKLQGEGKSGRQLSEELAELAAQQAQIRQMLKTLLDNNKGTEAGQKQSDQVSDLLKQMDQTETDLVNKRVSQQTINRQKDIQVRLLESEKALREQEEEQKRQAQTAKTNLPHPNPAYLPNFSTRTYPKQTEMLQTISPSYNSFYKNQSQSYLRMVNP